MKTLMVAHRGDTRQAKENTLEAFAAAYKHGFKAVECDVWLTKAGQLAVYHDSSAEKLVKHPGLAADLSPAELEKYKVPTLHQVLDLAKSRRGKVIVEIKALDDEGAVKTAAAVIDLLKKQPKRFQRSVEVHSFWPGAVKTASSARISSAYIVDAVLPFNDLLGLCRKTGAGGVSLGGDYLSKKLVRQLNRHGLFVDAWTVNDPTTYRRLRRMGPKALLENVSQMF